VKDQKHGWIIYFWPLNEKSQLFCCSIVKLPIITQHTEQPLKPLGQPSKLLHTLGDGNCLFRALSYVITGRQVYHAQVRNKIINHMRSIENILVPHINTSLKCYLHKTGVAQSGVWGTDIEILSASSLLSTDIFVYTKFGKTYKWQKFSRTMLGCQKPENNCSIYLNHTNSIHFDVVIDVSANQTDQQFLIGSHSGQNCTIQAKDQFRDEQQSVGVICNKEIQNINSSSKKPLKKCSSKSEKDSVVNENCRKRPKLVNDQNDISVNNVNQQFYSGSPSDQNHNFPSSATFKSEHSFSTIYSRKNQTAETSSKKNLEKCNLKSVNQSTDSRNCTKQPIFVKDQTNAGVPAEKP